MRDAIPVRFRIRLLLLLSIALVSVQALAYASPSFVIPFQYSDGLIWLKIKVNGADQPLNILLDSGANCSVINLETAKKLGLNFGKPVAVDSVDGRTIGYWPEHLPATKNSISLPENLLAVDLSELSQGSKCEVGGLLGADFFAQHVVRINFHDHEICIDPNVMKEDVQDSLPLAQRDGAIEVPVSVNDGAPQWMRLDTGCNSALHWVNANVQPVASKSQMAVALSKVCLQTTATRVRFGATIFDQVPTAVHASEIFPGEAGLLGNGILDRFDSVIISLPSNRLFVSKNACR